MHEPHNRPSGRFSTARARAARKELTPMEAKLLVAMRRLRPTGHHFRRQVPIGRWLADFASLEDRLVVEVDGSGHGDPERAARYAFRDADLRRQGFRTARFWTWRVDRELSDVMDEIWARLEDPARYWD